ncbi:MAG: hypothetical protein M1831_002762 [Alyxoria varia]|nr:MAG: hypothetical protein M1831_002762 [Alyxoria varia]
MWLSIKLSLLGVVAAAGLATPLKTNQNQDMIGVDANTYLYLSNDNIPQDWPGPAPGFPEMKPMKPSTRPSKPPPNYWLDRTRGDIRAAKPPSKEVCRYFYGIARMWLNDMDNSHVPTNATEYVAREHVIRLVWDNLKDPSGQGVSWDGTKLALDTPVIRNQPDECDSAHLNGSDPDRHSMNQWLWNRLSEYNGWAMSGMLVHSSLPMGFSYRIYHASELEEPSGKVPSPDLPNAPIESTPKRTPFGSPIINYPRKPAPPLQPVGSLPRIVADTLHKGQEGGPQLPPLPQLFPDDRLSVDNEAMNRLRAELKNGIELTGRVLSFTWSKLDFDSSTKKTVENLTGYKLSIARMFVWLVWGH